MSGHEESERRISAFSRFETEQLTCCYLFENLNIKRINTLFHGGGVQMLCLVHKAMISSTVVEVVVVKVMHLCMGLKLIQ